MAIKVRKYNHKTDYDKVINLYKKPETFGGQFDKLRDSKGKMKLLSELKPDAILVAEDNGKFIGTLTIFEDGRNAWLIRFAAEKKSISALFSEATKILKKMGHKTVLVYAPNDESFDSRYIALGFKKGSDYTCYWQDI